MVDQDEYSFKLITDWLKEQPQDAWLIFASCANWGYAEPVFEWMVDQEQCDRSVAARILWWSSPSYFLVTNNLKFGGELVVKIIENFHTGYYQNCELSIDPYDLLPEIQSYASDVANLDGKKALFVIPDELIGPFVGREAVIPSSEDIEGDSELKKMFNLFDTVMYQTWSEVSKHKFTSEQSFKKLYEIPELTDGSDEVGHIERYYGSLERYTAAREILTGPPKENQLTWVERQQRSIDISNAYSELADLQERENKRSFMGKLLRSFFRKN